ncbi:MAG: ribosome silencing factor [Elainellaceae cyanobacterium]
MSNHFKTRLNTPTPSARAGSLASLSEIDSSSLELAMTVCQAADERKGADITLLRVADVCYLADYFVIITGFSNVQVRAIARFIQDTVEDDWQRKPEQVEGMSEGRWVLLDYGEVIVHIFLPQEREFYNLEAFWGHAERIEFFASES